MPRVKALCIGPKRGEPKRPVPEARFRAGHGVEGDAHAGPGHRQVSLLADEDIEAIRRAGLPDVLPGAFAENVVLSGLDLGADAPHALGADTVLGRRGIGHGSAASEGSTRTAQTLNSGIFATGSSAAMVRRLAGDSR
jgi:hypothetical protein